METEAQKWRVVCPRAHSQEGTELEWEPRSAWPQCGPGMVVVGSDGKSPREGPGRVVPEQSGEVGPAAPESPAPWKWLGSSQLNKTNTVVAMEWRSWDEVSSQSLEVCKPWQNRPLEVVL